jgi:hypothetical protein
MLQSKMNTPNQPLFHEKRRGVVCPIPKIGDKSLLLKEEGASEKDQEVGASEKKKKKERESLPPLRS